MNNLKILYESMEYFLPYIDDDRITYTYKFHRGYRIQNKVLGMHPNVGKLLLNDWHKDIGNIDIFIMFDSHYIRKVAEYIKLINPRSKIYFYFWNSIGDHNKHFLNENVVDEFWTFDKEDAKKFNINYNSQFYTRNIIAEDKEKSIDTFFLGREKHRKHLIDDAYFRLKRNGISSKIYLAKNDETIFSYSDYLEKIKESRSLLDIVNPNQSGLTLRCMEALFLRKKLITNNLSISEYDFYNRNNIFILGKDNDKELLEFINSDYIDIDSNIVLNYDYNNWVKRFIR